LSSGVVVHNSEKDCTDGFVGALSNAFRIEGLTREEIIAQQFLQGGSGFYEEGQDPFYDEIVDNARLSSEDSFYNDILKQIT